MDGNDNINNEDTVKHPEGLADQHQQQEEDTNVASQNRLSIPYLTMAAVAAEGNGGTTSQNTANFVGYYSHGRLGVGMLGQGQNGQRPGVQLPSFQHFENGHYGDPRMMQPPPQHQHQHPALQHQGLQHPMNPASHPQQPPQAPPQQQQPQQQQPGQPQPQQQQPQQGPTPNFHPQSFPDPNQGGVKPEYTLNPTSAGPSGIQNPTGMLPNQEVDPNPLSQPYPPQEYTLNPNFQQQHGGMVGNPYQNLTIQPDHLIYGPPPPHYAPHPYAIPYPRIPPPPNPYPYDPYRQIRPPAPPPHHHPGMMPIAPRPLSPLPDGILRYDPSNFKRSLLHHHFDTKDPAIEFIKTECRKYGFSVLVRTSKPDYVVVICNCGRRLKRLKGERKRNRRFKTAMTGCEWRVVLFRGGGKKWEFRATPKMDHNHGLPVVDANAG